MDPSRQGRSAWLKFLPRVIRQQFTRKVASHAAIGNSLWLFADKILRMVLGVLVGAWVARYLGPELFGTFSYALALVVLFQAIAKLGVDTIVVRDLSRNDASAPEVLGTALRLRIVSGIGLWVISIFSAIALNPDNPRIALLVAIIGAGILFQAADTVDLWFQSRHESRRTVVPKASAYILANGLKVVAIFLAAPIEVFAALVAVEFILSALFLLLSYRRSPISNPWTGSVLRARVLLKESWPLLLSGIAVMVYFRIDQIALGHYSSAKELGIYSAAIALAEAWNFIPMIVAISVAPTLSRLWASDREQYRAGFNKVLRLVGLGTVGVAILTALGSPWLVFLLFGAQYEESASILRVVIFSFPFLSLGVITSVWLTNEGLTRVALWRALFGACIKIIFTIILVPRYGAMGAAISTVITQFCAAVLFHAFLKSTRRLFVAQCRGLIGV